VWCKGHEYFHLIPLNSKVYAILENSPDMGLEIENTHDFKIAFTCDKKKFFYTRFNENTIKPKSSELRILMGLEKGEHPSPPQKTIEQTASSPFLDKIKSALEEKSKKLYQQNIE